MLSSCSIQRVLLVVALSATPWLVNAQTAFPATLSGHAILPPQTMIAAPKDAPADLQSSGKFTTGQRVDKTATVDG